MEKHGDRGVSYLLAPAEELTAFRSWGLVTF